MKLPPEIALQDTQDDLDFTPRSSPSPTPKPPQTYQTFQRTQPAKFPVLKPVNDSSLDLTSLGISEKRLAPFRDSADTMDWIPSSQPNSFAPRPIPAYSHETSVFAAGRGTLPPAPGSAFPAVTTKSLETNEVNWFKPSANASLQQLNESVPPRNQATQLHEQRLFLPQVLNRSM